MFLYPAVGVSWQLGVLEMIASKVEWPLLIIRHATVPIVEQEFYSRPWFLTSLVRPKALQARSTFSLWILLVAHPHP